MRGQRCRNIRVIAEGKGNLRELNDAFSGNYKSAAKLLRIPGWHTLAVSLPHGSPTVLQRLNIHQI